MNELHRGIRPLCLRQAVFSPHQIDKLTMELQLESQARQQLAARTQELQGLLETLERKQSEQKAQAQRREMELLKRIEQVSYVPLACVWLWPRL